MVPLIGGGFLLAQGTKLLKKESELRKNGRVADGIILVANNEIDDFGPTTDFQGKNGLRGNSPIVRFLSEKKEWITARSSYPSHNRYKEGQAVKIIHDRHNPSDFLIDSRLTKVFPLIMQVLGGLLALAGVIIFLIRI